MLTVPSLIISNQEKGWNTASKVFETKLEQALKVMNTQQTLAGYRTTKDFVNELRNHFKITKVCDKVTDCFEDKVIWGTDLKVVDMTKITTAKNFGQNDWGTETLGVQFGNGTTGVIAYNPDCKQNPYTNQITGTSCLGILYDVSGFTKPNTQSKDVRAINILRLGDAYAFELNGTKYSYPFIPVPLSYNECLKAKDKLGIVHCSNYFYQDSDYWAGALAACGGKNKVPSPQQLDEIGSKIYSNELPDEDVRLAYGLPELSFHLWSNKEDTDYNYPANDGTKIYPGAFLSFFTRGNYWSAADNSLNRGDSNTYAICIVN